jgi:hypothetical protein
MKLALPRPAGFMLKKFPKRQNGRKKISPRKLKTSTGKGAKNAKKEWGSPLSKALGIPAFRGRTPSSAASCAPAIEQV